MNTPAQTSTPHNLHSLNKQTIPNHDLPLSIPSYSPDWREFDPSAYLNEYYADLGEENVAILRFYSDVFRAMTPKSVMLDFGSGPTIYSLISAVTKVEEIHAPDHPTGQQ